MDATPGPPGASVGSEGDRSNVLPSPPAGPAAGGSRSADRLSCGEAGPVPPPLPPTDLAGLVPCEGERGRGGGALVGTALAPRPLHAGSEAVPGDAAALGGDAGDGTRLVVLPPSASDGGSPKEALGASAMQADSPLFERKREAHDGSDDGDDAVAHAPDARGVGADARLGVAERTSTAAAATGAAMPGAPQAEAFHGGALHGAVPPASFVAEGAGASDGATAPAGALRSGPGGAEEPMGNASGGGVNSADVHVGSRVHCAPPVHPPVDSFGSPSRHGLFPGSVPAPSRSFFPSSCPPPSVKSLPVRQYLEETVVPVLMACMRRLAEDRPDDPLEELAGMLTEHVRDAKRRKLMGGAPAGGWI